MDYRLIDVTLRDGGYRNGHAFDERAATFLVGRAAAAGVHFIEVGYRGGPLKVTPGLGVCGLSPDAYLAALREAHPEASLAVMAHPRHIKEADIDALAAAKVELLRLCIDVEDVARSEALFRRAKKAGLMVSANFTRITARPLEVTLGVMERFTEADVIYVADSNGSMTPGEVRTLTHRLREALPTPLGFHAHNNLSLALANTTAALEAGMTWVDASLRGMGRGAGNLATEIYVAYCERLGLESGLDAAAVLELAEDWERLWMAEPMRLTPLEATLGAYNLPGDFEGTMRTVAKQLQVHWSAVAGHLDKLARAAAMTAGDQGRKAPLALVTNEGR